MARGFKGFVQRGVEIGTALDRVAASLTLGGPTLAAQRIVAELQQEGPSWTGRFSNSWQIQGPQGQLVKGDGNPGEPRPVRFETAPFTGPQATATIFRTNVLKDKIIFRVSNFSPYAAQATDVEQGNFVRPSPLPLTELGKRKFDPAPGGRKNPSFRWDIGSGTNSSSSSRTADQDWLADYASGGRMNKAVRIEMEAALRALR